MLDNYPIFQRVEDKTQVPKEYVAVGVVPVVLLGLFLGGGVRLIRYVFFFFFLLLTYSRLWCVEGDLMFLYACHVCNFF